MVWRKRTKIRSKQAHLNVGEPQNKIDSPLTYHPVNVDDGSGNELIRGTVDGDHLGVIIGTQRLYGRIAFDVVPGKDLVAHIIVAKRLPIGMG